LFVDKQKAILAREEAELKYYGKFRPRHAAVLA
jgi:hypothetical protein